MTTSDSPSSSDPERAISATSITAGSDRNQPRSFTTILSLVLAAAGLGAAGYFWNQANVAREAVSDSIPDQEVSIATASSDESARDALLDGIEELVRESDADSVAWATILEKLETVTANLPPSNEQATMFQKLAATHKSRGNYRDAVNLSRRASEALNEEAKVEERLRIRAELAFSLLLVGDIPEGSQLIEELLSESKSSLTEDDPLRLAIVNASANVDFMKGDIDKGLEKARSAVKGRELELQQNNPNILFALNSLMMVSTADQQVGNAIKYAQELTKLWEQKNPKHVAALAARSHLASLLQRVEGAQQQSADAMADVYERSKLARGAKDVQTLQLAANYVQSLLRAQEYEKAIEIAEVAAADAKEVLGKTHPIATANCRGLALAYHFSGDSERAVPLIEAVLESLADSVGKDDERYLQSMSDLAVVYYGAGNNEAGDKMAQDALDGCRTLLGEEHQRTQTLTFALAQKSEEQQLFAKAAELYLSNYNWRKGNLPALDESALGCGAKAAVMFRLAGKPERTIELLDDVRPKAKEMLGDANSVTLLTGVLLSRAKVDVGALEEADSLISETLEQSTTTLGEAHGVTSDARATKFALLMARGEHQAAEETAMLLLEQVKEAPGTNNLRLALAANMIAEAKLRTGDNAGAAQLLTAIVASIDEKFAEHTLVANSQVLLGEAKMAQDDLAAAEEYLLQGESSLGKNLGRLTPEDKKRLTLARKLLVGLFESKGDQGRAAEFQDAPNADSE